MWAVVMLGCRGSQSDLPKKIVGTWELHQVEVAGGEVDAQTAVTNGHPGCTWGRMTLSFEEGSDEGSGGKAKAEKGAERVPGFLSSTTDVLCPTNTTGELYGCTVSARVPAEWDVKAGKWVVTSGTTVRNRTRPLDASAMAGGTTCEAKVSSGDYPVVTVRGQKWKWEMRTPDGTVFRLRAPTSEHPDFVAAIQRQQRMAASPVAETPAPPEGPAATPGGK